MCLAQGYHANLQPLDLKSSTLPLSHYPPLLFCRIDTLILPTMGYTDCHMLGVHWLYCHQAHGCQVTLL